MSIGPFQHLQTSHEVGSGSGLACEPWLLPISDDVPPPALTAESLQGAVKQASRRFWMAANALFAVLAVLLSVQVANDLNSPVARPDTGGQIAEATPPTIAAEAASLAGHH